MKCIGHAFFILLDGVCNTVFELQVCNFGHASFTRPKTVSTVPIHPVLGRFNAMDPMVDKYADWTPYNFAFNDPANKNDPGGDDPNIRYLAPPARETASGGWSPAPMVPQPNFEAWVAQQMAASQAAAVGGFYQFLQDSYSWQKEGAKQMAAYAASQSSGGNNPGFYAQLATLTAGHYSGTDLDKLAGNFYSSGNILNGGWLNGIIVRPSGVTYSSDWGTQRNFEGTAGGASQGGTTHDQELAKYGQIAAVFNVSGGVQIVGGVAMEYGTLVTDKGYNQNYRTTYPTIYGYGASIGGNFGVIFGRGNYKPTFSDWKGYAYNGISGSFEIINGSWGHTASYNVFTSGLGYGMNYKDNRFNGTYNPVSITTLIGQPYQPPQTNTDFSSIYIHSYGQH